jgi:hypothetical protein
MNEGRIKDQVIALVNEVAGEGEVIHEDPDDGASVLGRRWVHGAHEFLVFLVADGADAPELNVRLVLDREQGWTLQLIFSGGKWSPIVTAPEGREQFHKLSKLWRVIEESLEPDPLGEGLYSIQSESVPGLVRGIAEHLVGTP